MSARPPPLPPPGVRLPSFLSARGACSLPPALAAFMPKVALCLVRLDAGERDVLVLHSYNQQLRRCNVHLIVEEVAKRQRGGLNYDESVPAYLPHSSYPMATFTVP